MGMKNAPRATDMLANERTFLAYLRTALSFIAFGFVVARFALFTREIALVLHTAERAQRFSTGFGTAIALFGAVVAAYGGYRYVAADRALKRGDAVTASSIPATTGAVVVVIIGVVVGIGLIAFQ
jgi:putative membrane protein